MGTGEFNATETGISSGLMSHLARLQTSPLVGAPIIKSRQTCHRAVCPSITPYCCLRILLCYLLSSCVTFYN